MAEEQEQESVTVVEVDQPIINSPFSEPAWHWKIEMGKEPVKAKGRRRASYFYRVPERVGRGRLRTDEADFFESEKGEEVELEIVNAIRERIAEWRIGSRSDGIPYDGISPVTRELLDLWRSEERKERLFFAQIEAVETIIFLVEAADIYRKGLPKIPRDKPGAEAQSSGVRAFTRYACKMATGSGKTTVMGMLAAWSILNRFASRGDARFSDTVLIVCPNVTIRERLQELDPARGDLSLYRTRQLVPPHRMEELRRGEVMIANWHRLAKKEVNTVNGVSANVVKTGEAVAIVKNEGRGNESVEIKYYESDKAWFKRIRRELGSGRGSSARWLVFNDEAHHAYRRGDAVKRTDSDETADASTDSEPRGVSTPITGAGRGGGAPSVFLDEDINLAKKNMREATIWIEGLDRVGRMAGGRSHGIGLCVDLSATPFYIQGSGNEVGKPFPWIVSDFGLLDAIESGLVKIPQISTRDQSGAPEPAYFNIWRWMEKKMKKDGRSDEITPQVVLRHASTPINLLAQEWHHRFKEWTDAESGNFQRTVPPVFIVVCRDIAIAREVHDWLANGNDSYGASPEWFLNESDREVTVRIDSSAIDDIEQGVGKDNTRRLRYILDTVGRLEWPGAKVPDDWSALIARHNKKVEDDESGSMRWIDERIPPGRDVRCIVSVSMLTEGWDANTVTHIVGLRPFGSQLLCEQVVGRALRRRHYVLDEKTDMFREEVATVFGVPFEIVPFKAKPSGPQLPQPVQRHIHAVPEKAQYEITVPVVEGYHQTQTFDVLVDWNGVSKLTVDPMELPQSVDLDALTAPEGRLAAYGPGKTVRLSLADWRVQFREQQVAFRLAGEVCRRWQEDKGTEAVPVQTLFPKVVRAAMHFLAEKVDARGDSEPRDILAHGVYMEVAVESLIEAIRIGARLDEGEVAVIPCGSAGLRSTRHVDFHTAKPTYPARRCHLNEMVADTAIWEQSAANVLDSHPGVLRWVKNEGLKFKIPYRYRGRTANYLPDFVVETDLGESVIVEVKGRVRDVDDAKAKAAVRWTEAVNRLGTHGRWRYVMVTDPQTLGPLLDDACGAKWNDVAREFISSEALPVV